LPGFTNAVGALVADRRGRHAIGTDRASAPRAVHASDHPGVPVAGLHHETGRPFGRIVSLGGRAGRPGLELIHRDRWYRPEAEA
jgi:hypothetical protein